MDRARDTQETVNAQKMSVEEMSHNNIIRVIRSLGRSWKASLDSNNNINWANWPPNVPNMDVNISFPALSHV